MCRRNTHARPVSCVSGSLACTQKHRRAYSRQSYEISAEFILSVSFTPENRYTHGTTALLMSYPALASGGLLRKHEDFSSLKHRTQVPTRRTRLGVTSVSGARYRAALEEARVTAEPAGKPIFSKRARAVRAARPAGAGAFVRTGIRDSTCSWLPAGSSACTTPWGAPIIFSRKINKAYGEMNHSWKTTWERDLLKSSSKVNFSMFHGFKNAYNKLITKAVGESESV